MYTDMVEFFHIFIVKHFRILIYIKILNPRTYYLTTVEALNCKFVQFKPPLIEQKYNSAYINAELS